MRQYQREKRCLVTVRPVVDRGAPGGPGAVAGKGTG